MPLNNPTNFPGGVTDVLASDPMAGLGLLDPTRFITLFHDFIGGQNHGIPIVTTGLAAAATATTGWVITVTEAGAGNAATSRTDGNGGLLTITNDAADNDAVFVQARGESFLWSATKRMFFETRFKVSNATQTDLVMGLQITDTTPLDVTDGLFFFKADDSTTLTFRVEKNDTATSVNVATMADDTFVTVAFFFNPDTGLFYIYLNNALIGTAPTTNAVDDEELTLSFGVQNGDANARSMTIDYIYCALER